jgi:hypothetical protein
MVQHCIRCLSSSPPPIIPTFGSLLTSKMAITISIVFMIIAVHPHMSSPYKFWGRLSRWYSIFFIVYVLLGVYFLTNLILAVIYDSFKEQVHLLCPNFSSVLLYSLLLNTSVFLLPRSLTWHSFGETVCKATSSGGLYKEKYITEGIWSYRYHSECFVVMFSWALTYCPLATVFW